MGQMVTPSHGLNGMVSACDVCVFVSGTVEGAPRAYWFPSRGGGLSGRRAAEAYGCPRLNHGRTVVGKGAFHRSAPRCGSDGVAVEACVGGG